MIPSKKDLEIILSTIEGFEKPKPELEQYVTPSDIAANLLWTAFMNGNIRKKIVVDLGCGTGIFVFGAALLEAKKVFGFDVDEDALKIARQSWEIIAGTKVPLTEVEFEKKDIKEVHQKCDTIIMNPPFGVQKRNADRIFLKKAFTLAKVVYSIHKAGSTNFLEKFAEDNGFSAAHIGTNVLKLPPTMKFHKERKHEVEISTWRFDKTGT